MLKWASLNEDPVSNTNTEIKAIYPLDRICLTCVINFFSILNLIQHTPVSLQCLNAAASLGERGEVPTVTNSAICAAENGGVKECVINFS